MDATMEGNSHDNYSTIEDESQDNYASMGEEIESQDSDAAMEDQSQENYSAMMQEESVGDYSVAATEEWENRSDYIPAVEDEDMNNTDSKVWVYTKHLRTPGAFHQVCMGEWTPEDPEQAHIDVVLGKGTYLSLHRFVEYEAGRPSGAWKLLHEQPVFGTIKDLKTIYIDFEDEEEHEQGAAGHNMEDICCNERPRMGYLPRSASRTLLAATSDSGFLTFLAFHYEDQKRGTGNRGYFYPVKKIDIAEPGYDYSETGAKVAVDPSSLVMAVSALEDHVKLFFLGSTKRSMFNPVQMTSSIKLKGVIIAMDFLGVDTEAELVVAILAVLYFNKVSGRYYISTFHIGPAYNGGEPPIHVGTSEVGSNPQHSVLLLKGLPNLPYSLVYIDEENITFVTTEQLTELDGTTTINHTHHKPLKLIKKESPMSESSDGDEPDTTFPLISACATSPKSEFPTYHQTLYLGSDTADFYRVNINGYTNTMNFELNAGERPIGGVMEVLTRHHNTVRLPSDPDQDTVLRTDYLLYSSEYGDGSILGVKEEEDTIGLYAVSELSNDAPVLDFCAPEPALPGRDSLFVCSGMKSEGCIKRIRSGILAESSGSSGQQLFEGATGVWSVKANHMDAFDSFLVVSFIQSTKLMKASGEGDFEDISNRCGLELSQATIAAGRLTDGVLFQVHRAGVVVVHPGTGHRQEWSPGNGVLASAAWASEGTLALGQILSGTSSLIVLELVRTKGGSRTQQPVLFSFRVVASKAMNAEPTTIYCWSEETLIEEPTKFDARAAEVHCCVGTLEPALYVFRITQNAIDEVYSESLAQEGRESVAVPHSISVLKNGEELQRILVGLRNGSMLAYEWNHQAQRQRQHQHQYSAGRMMSLSRRLFKLGIMPVKFAFSSSDDFSSLSKKTLILSDKIWQASFDSSEVEVQPVIFDNEVSQACAFGWEGADRSTRPGYVFIVEDHQDLQLVTLEGMSKYNSQTLFLGLTPRRLLEITSEGLLLAACVSDEFPFAESILQLMDPARVSNDAESESQHVIAGLFLRQGEGVYCLAEWKLPHKLLICVGTGIFSPTGAASSAASPRTGRLVILSIKHTKTKDQRLSQYELEEEWAVDMPLPVFAVSVFSDKKILVSSGPVLKLFGLSSNEKSLRELASVRERWPIVQISSQGKMIVTGSRGESINFYEHEAGVGENSFDKLKFFKSARSARQVSDCLAISPELAVGVDLSGAIFGVGYIPDATSRQYSLVDQFSFHLGEVVSRIRLAKLWIGEQRSLAGIPLPDRTSSTSTPDVLSKVDVDTSDDNDVNMDADAGTTEGVVSEGTSSPSTVTRPASFGWLFLSFVLTPWTPVDTSVDSNGDLSQSSTTQGTATTTPSRHLSSQALIGCTLTGSIVGFWRLNPVLYDILKSLQRVLETHYESRPVLGNNHGEYRNRPTNAFHTIDGDLVDRFLVLEHTVQIEVMDRAIRLEGMVEEWVRDCDGGNSRGGLAAALDREFRATASCAGSMARCVERAKARRSKYLDERGRPKRGDYRPKSQTEQQSEPEGTEESEDQGDPVDPSHVPCKAIHVLCCIVLFLRNLDWHQN
ncbi:hypothetical protein BGX29_009725 [Mortierella sp. GBA35]|nr:hypothetical protein BGX29_009725 [Mortierella sp. GBA35]